MQPRRTARMKSSASSAKASLFEVRVEHRSRGFSATLADHEPEESVVVAFEIRAVRLLGRVLCEASESAYN